MKNRWIALILVFAMLISAIPVAAEETGEGLTIVTQETASEEAKPAEEPQQAPEVVEIQVQATEPAQDPAPAQESQVKEAEAPASEEAPKAEEAPEAPAEEPAQEETPKASAEEPAQEETPKASAEEPAQEETPDASAEEPDQEETPKAPAEEPAQEETPDASAEEPAEETAGETALVEPAGEETTQPEEGEQAEESIGMETEQQPENMPVDGEAVPENGEENADQSVAKPENTIDGTEQGEEQQPQEAEEIDYSKKASENLMFVSGYAKTDSNAKLYENEHTYDFYGRASKGIVYVISRANIGETRDRLLVAFATEEGIVTTYVGAKYLTPMDEEAVKDFLRKDEAAEIATPHEYITKNGTHYVVGVLTITIEENETPDEGEETEQPTEPGEETKPEETEQPTEPGEETNPEETEQPTEPGEETKPEETEQPTEPGEETKPEETEQPTEPGNEFVIEIENVQGVVGNKEGKRVELPNVRTEMGVGESIEIKSVVYDAENQVVSSLLSYTSNAETVATVSKDGKVTGVGIGFAAITVKADNGASCILVLEVKPAPAQMTISGGATTMGRNQSLRLTCQMADKAAGAVSWKSSDTSVATVDENGVVTTHAYGVVVIQAIAYNGVSASCAITVVEEPTNIELNVSQMTLNENESADLIAAFKGDVAGTVKFALESESDVIELEAISDTWTKVHALRSGKAVVTATVQNSNLGTTYSARCEVTVVPAVSRIELKGLQTVIGQKETVDLKPVAYDARGNEISATFTIETSNKAKVSVKNGTSVYGAAVGSADIRVKAANGVSAYAAIRVVKAPTAVTLNNKTATISVGEPFSLTAELTAGTASVITWTTDNPSVATVDAEGNVHALSAGVVNVTAAAFNGKKATCNVTVLAAPDGLAFEQSTYSVVEALTVAPTLNKRVKAEYSIENSDPAKAVAGVNEKTGVVTGFASGEATLVATVYNYVTGENVTARTKIVVVPGPSRVDTTAVDGPIGVGESVDLAPKAFDRDGAPVNTTFTLTASSKVVTVNGTTVKGAKAGTATVTVTAENGMSTVISFTVMNAPNKVTLNKTKAQLIAGETMNLAATLPAKTAGKVTWTSSSACVEVDADGTVKAVSAGEAVVKATTYNNKTASCTITVLDAPTAIAFSASEFTVKEGATVAIPAIVTPMGAGGTVKYTIENPEYERVATINSQTGAVTGLVAGTAKVTATVYSPKLGAEMSATCTVNVVPGPVKVKLINERTTIAAKETITLEPVAYDARGNVVETQFTVTTSNKKYVETNGTNTLTGVRAGSATITIAAENGVSYKLTVKTVTAPSKISFEYAELSIAQGSSVQPKVVYPNGQSGGLSWKSEDEEIATVNANGLITARKVGETRVQAETFNGKTAILTVKVVASAGAASFVQNEYAVAAGSTVKPLLQFSVEGVYASATYSISDDDPNYVIARVDANTGVVEGLVSGVAKVTATVFDAELNANRTAECWIHVSAAPEYIVLNDENTVLGVKEILDLKPVAYDARGQKVETTFTYKSSKTNIASVSAGKVTAKAAGTSEITVTAANGVSATVTVTVKKAPTAVTLSKTALNLSVGETAQLSAELSSDSVGLITWDSENAQVATVDANGVVKAVSAGTTRVRVRTFNGKQAYCSVTVGATPGSIAFAKSEYLISVGASEQLTLTAGAVKAQFTAADGTVLRVNAQTGVVDGLRMGETTVTATVRNYETNEDLTCQAKVTVVAPPVRVEVPTTTLILGLKETYEISAQAYDMTGQQMAATISVATGNKSIVSVTGNKLTGAKVGKTTVSVSANGGARAIIEVEVRKAPTKITISGEGNRLAVGETMKLSAELTAGTYSDIKWTSEAEQIAKVDSNGVVTAVSAGTVRIKAATFNNRSAFYTLTVGASPVSISFGQSTYTLGEGQTLATTLEMLPAGSYGKAKYEIVTTGSETGIASVDQNGVVKGLRSGTATLIATVHDTVNNKDVQTFTIVAVMPAAARIEFLGARSTVGLKETLDLKPVAYDANGEVIDTNITLVSSKTAYITVNGSQIFGKAVGTSEITARAENGVTAKLTVKVMKAPTGVSIEPTTVDIPVSGTVALKAVLPANQDSAIKWRSSDTAIATVDENGVVKAVAGGTAKIYATTFNGKEAGCTVNVVGEPTGLSFAETGISIGEGSFYTATAQHAAGSAGAITYISLNPFVAKVDSATGRVSALKQGTTRIIATTINNQTKQVYTASYELTVTPAPVRVEFKNLRTTVGVNEVIAVEAVAYDGNGNEVKGEYTLKTSNTKYLKVSGSQATAVRTGSATLTVTTYNGVTASEKITITAAPTGIKIAPTSIITSVGNDPVQLAVTFNNKSASAIKWESADAAIATVDAEGRVSGLAYGTTQIKATTYNGKYALCTVNVFNAPESVTFTEKSFELGEGATKQLTARLNETAAGAIYYATGDAEVAKVDANGVVTAVRTGTTTITATTYNGKSDVCTVVVTPAPVRVEYKDLRTTVGVNEVLAVETVAYDGSGNVVDGKVTLKSSSSVLKVSGSQVTAARTGSATLTVTTYNGVTTSQKITVTAAPTGIKIAPTSIITSIGNDPVQLAVTFNNKSASAIKWESADAAIATVDAEGRVSGLAYGTTQIKATTYNGKYALCTVNVFNAPESVSFGVSKLTLGVSDTGKLTATVNEKAAGAIYYQSSDEHIATVAADGTVTAKGIGTASIVATTYNGKTDVCEVKVLAAPAYIKLEQTPIIIGVGQTIDMNTLVVIPEDSATSLKFTTESAAIAKVSAEGVITAVKVGKTRIKATTHNGLTCILSVEVQKAATSISVKIADPVIYLGESTQLSVTVGNGSMASWTVKSNNPEICDVSEDGLTLTGKAVGTAVITVTTHTGVIGTAMIEVAQHVEGLTISDATLSIEHYASAILTANVTPETAYNKRVNWVSSDPESVSVDALGKVTALNLTDKSVTITGTTEDGGFKATCIVTVTPVRVQSMTLTESAVALEKLNTHALEVVIVPDNADNQKIKWVSSNPSVISVDETGMLTALTNEGSAKITATSEDGGFVAECLVTAVRVKPTGIALGSKSFEMMNLSTAQMEATITPAGGEYRTMTWTSSDESVLTVDANGVVSAHKPGSATVTVTIEDYEGKKLTASCDFIVDPIQVKGVTLNSEELGMRQGKTAKLTANLQPADADNKAVTWTSSAPGVVSVTDNGDLTATLTAIGVGTANITVKTADGGYTASCAVTVYDKLEVKAEPNFERNTVGNDIVWTIVCDSALGTPSYEISVTKNGSAYQYSKSGSTVTLSTPDIGDYTILVTVTDETGETASCTNTVNMAEAQTFVSDGLTYSYRITQANGAVGAAIVLVDKSTSKTSITIPKTANGVKIVRIDTEAFMGMVSLKKVSMPNTVKVVGARAFKGCAALTDLETYSAQ